MNLKQSSHTDVLGKGVRGVSRGGLTPSCSTPLADKWQAQGPQKRERGRRPPFHWTWAQ